MRDKLDARRERFLVELDEVSSAISGSESERSFVHAEKLRAAEAASLANDRAMRAFRLTEAERLDQWARSKRRADLTAKEILSERKHRSPRNAAGERFNLRSLRLLDEHSRISLLVRERLSVLNSAAPSAEQLQSRLNRSLLPKIER